MPIRDFLARMRHDGCGGRAAKAELLTGVQGANSRPVRRSDAPARSEPNEWPLCAPAADLLGLSLLRHMTLPMASIGPSGVPLVSSRFAATAAAAGGSMSL